MQGTAFLEAALILLREGLEAILVIAALAAYLTKMGSASRLSALYTGAGAAVLASVAAAWVFERFYGGMHNDLLEGVIILMSAALMFYVSGWLMLKQDPKAWSAYLSSQTARVAGGSSALAIAALAFLAVFREGAETVLFLHALSRTAGGWGPGMLAGMLAATVVLAGLFVAIRRTTQRLPLRAVFIATSAFLFLMGLKFVGEAMQEFQEQALVPYDAAPFADWLQAVGLNPTWEALAAQVTIVVMAIMTWLWIKPAATHQA